MSRRGAAGAKLFVATLAVLLALAGGTAIGAGTESGGFTRYVSCSPYGKSHSAPTHICQQGDLLWAVLRYGGAPVEYEVCIRRGSGPTTCAPPQLTVQGGSSVTKVPSENFVGLVTVSWHSGGAEIGSYTVRFVKDPVVPPFGVAPLIVSETHRLFGLIVRHVSPGLRVRAWRVCNRGCPLPLKPVAHEGETRRYRITGSRRNSTFSLGDLLYVVVDAPRRPKGSQLWSRLYQGKLVRDRSGSPSDTAIRRIGPSLCSPPGLPFGFARKCWKARSPQAPLVPPEG